MHVVIAAIIAVITLGAAAPGAAHIVEDASHAAQHAAPATFTPGWTFEPWAIACLVLSLLLYALGAARLWERLKNGRGVVARQIGYFMAGWLTLVAALVSPLDAMGGLLFSAHMVQHELLMIVAAPLFVLSRPLGVWMWALPRRARQAVGKATQAPAAGAIWKGFTNPVNAWILHAAALWLWHVPPFFQASLVSNAVHTLQHASFLITALLFWWAVLNASMEGRPHGASIIYLFTTMMHTGSLGALLTVSANVWYPAYAATTGLFGLEPIEDQQLGGLIMWIPGGLSYLIAGLFLGSRWLVDKSGAARGAAHHPATIRDER